MAVEIKNGLIRFQILNTQQHQKLIDQGVELISEKAKDNLMLKHKKRELKRMARRGHLVGLVEISGDGKETLKGIAGTNEIHRRRVLFGRIQFGKIQAAEIGSVAIAKDYEGNGHGREIVQETARAFMNGASGRNELTEDFMLFAMVKSDNEASKRMFGKIGNPIDLSALPRRALRFGRDYKGYDITHQGQI